MLLIFNEEKVEYMVVGAYALAVHGLPRATGDIDLWIKISNENAEKVWRSLIKFGVPFINLNKEDLKTPGIVFQVGIAPRRIDILTSIDGVDYIEAENEMLKVNVDNLIIPIIGKKHLILNKKTVGRPKDQADVSWLEKSE